MVRIGGGADLTGFHQALVDPEGFPARSPGQKATRQILSGLYARSKTGIFIRTPPFLMAPQGSLTPVVGVTFAAGRPHYQRNGMPDDRQGGSLGLRSVVSG